MAKRRVPPTPQNFSEWFAYVSGNFPELIRAIEILDSNRAEYTPERNAELYERLIGDTRSANQLREAGERISAAVSMAIDLIQRAGLGTKRYGEKLDQVSEAMEGPLDAASLKTVVEQILGDT